MNQTKSFRKYGIHVSDLSATLAVRGGHQELSILELKLLCRDVIAALKMLERAETNSTTGDNAA